MPNVSGDSDAEIEDLGDVMHATVAAQQDIGGFDVAMNKPEVVGFLQ
jgi:hypothetical protein